MAGERTFIPQKHEVLFASATRTIAGQPYAGSGVRTRGRKGAVVFLDITANTGVFTLDVKIQGYDETAGKWIDVVGAAFAQKSGTGHSVVSIYPGIKETANSEISEILPAQIRAHATLGGGGTDVTFSVSADLIP